MIINNENKFIFIHIPKTGGTALRHMLKIFKSGKFNKHDPIGELRERDENVFKDYFKFSIVRNPYDCFLSKFFYFNERRKFNFEEMGFDKTKLFFENVYLNRFVGGNYDVMSALHERVPQHHYICDIEDNILVDYVCKYENLKTDLDIVFKKLNLTYTSEELSVVNASYKPTTYNKKDLLTKEVKEVIYNLYEKDFKIFGYPKEYPV